MNDTQLGNWMRDLPRTSASPAFTSDVMRAVRHGARPEKRVPFAYRMAAAFAMILCLLAVTQVAVMQYTHRQRLESLRAEQQKIEAELQAVKKIAADAEPVVVLENREGDRVIMDLDSAVQTASYKTYD